MLSDSPHGLLSFGDRVPLPLGCRDPAFNGERDTVGTWYSQAGSVASDLERRFQRRFNHDMDGSDVLHNMIEECSRYIPSWHDKSV